MALYKFTKSIINNQPIRVFNNGKMIRDFTFIDDVIESIFRLIQKIPKRNSTFNKNYGPCESWAPTGVPIWQLNPTNLQDYIKEIERNLGKKADIIFEKMQPGDVEATYADTKSLEKLIDFKPNTSIQLGIQKFISWF